MILGTANLNAQNDGFFTSSYSDYREDEWSSTMPSLPGYHGGLNDYQAVPETPIGSGLLILGALALGYNRFKSEKLRNSCQQSAVSCQ